MVNGIRVKHVNFGTGTIVSLEQGRMRISFDQPQTTRVFSYPDAFERFLTTEDPELKARTEHSLKESLESHKMRAQEETQKALTRCETIYREALEQKKKKSPSRRKTVAK